MVGVITHHCYTSIPLWSLSQIYAALKEICYGNKSWCISGRCTSTNKQTFICAVGVPMTVCKAILPRITLKLHRNSPSPFSKPVDMCCNYSRETRPCHAHALGVALASSEMLNHFQDPTSHFQMPSRGRTSIFIGTSLSLLSDTLSTLILQVTS